MRSKAYPGVNDRAPIPWFLAHSSADSIVVGPSREEISADEPGALNKTWPKLPRIVSLPHGLENEELGNIRSGQYFLRVAWRIRSLAEQKLVDVNGIALCSGRNYVPSACLVLYYPVLHGFLRIIGFVQIRVSITASAQDKVFIARLVLPMHRTTIRNMFGGFAQEFNALKAETLGIEWVESVPRGTFVVRLRVFGFVHRGLGW